MGACVDAAVSVRAGGPQYGYTYDNLFRPLRLQGPNNQALVSSVSYGYANEMLQLSASAFTETRTYNANFQLTELISGSNVHFKYNYSATQNNGRILSMSDVMSGETIAYTYDSLNRLLQASGTGDPSGAWSQQFAYDGYGNLTQKAGSNAPANSYLADPANNQLTGNGAQYDADGNLSAYGTGSFAVSYSYDVENRMLSATPVGSTQTAFGYDQSNQRIYQGTYNTSTGVYSNEQIYFYGAEGKKLAVYALQSSGSTVTLTATQTKVWFAGRLLVPQDQLQSQGKYFPYGEDRYSPNPANPSNDTEKFATYTRDSATGLDYAYQRYYSSGFGRFETVDPYAGSMKMRRPQDFNRYSYAGNEPVANLDPSGAFYISVPSGCNSVTSDADAFFDPFDFLESDPVSTCMPFVSYGLYQTQARTTVDCQIDLLTQVIKPAGYNILFNHTSIELEEKVNGNSVAPVYINGIPGPHNYLTANIGAAPYYTGSQLSAVWSSGYSYANCAESQNVLKSAANFPNNKFPYLLVQLNSNTLTHALLSIKNNVLLLSVNIAEALNPLVLGWSDPIWW